MSQQEKEQVERRGGIPRGIATSGPALLSYGFRPFFLAAGVYAVIAMSVWIGALAFGWPVGGGYGGPAWHGHELLFGYTAAALAGFMLTAIPNWTGRLPVSGRPLLLLVLLWLAGRLAMAVPDALGMPMTAVLDAAFLPALAAIAAREIITGRNWKNLKILLALCALSLANIGFHLVALFDGDLSLWLRVAVAVFVILVTLVGGRVVPSFTRNWLSRQGGQRLPHPFGRLDVVAMVAAGLALALWSVLPERPETAALAFVAAAAQMLRLLGWRGYLAVAEPLVAVLHVAYLFVPLGLLAVGLAALGWISLASALHVLTAGSIAGMTLAIMTRATLGHTGRKLVASPRTVIAYSALFIAAIVRPIADLAPDLYLSLLGIAGVAWIVAFALFVVEYGPMLVRPRQ